MKRELGLRTLDLAKRLLDHGFHPPTVYFPLLVDEALLIEPTETETMETLDLFAEAMANILREGAEDPEIARNAPYGTPVRRLDEAGAQAAGHPDGAVCGYDGSAASAAAAVQPHSTTSMRRLPQQAAHRCIRQRSPSSH